MSMSLKREVEPYWIRISRSISGKYTRKPLSDLPWDRLKEIAEEHKPEDPALEQRFNLKAMSRVL